MLYTGRVDFNEVPILVGDLIQTYLFSTAHRRKIYGYLMIEVNASGEVVCRSIVDNPDSHCFPIGKLNPGMQVKVMDGPGVRITHAPSGIYAQMVYYWERNKIPLKKWEEINER